MKQTSPDRARAKEEFHTTCTESSHYSNKLDLVVQAGLGILQLAKYECAPNISYYAIASKHTVQLDIFMTQIAFRCVII